MKLSLIIFVIIGTVKSQFTGRCTANPAVCCKGVNSSCRRGDCYCDEYCSANKDCCPDFGAACSGGVSLSTTTGTTVTTIASNTTSTISTLRILSTSIQNATTRQSNPSTPIVSTAVSSNLTQSVPFTTQSTTNTTSRLSSTSSSQTSPAVITAFSTSSPGLSTSDTGLSALSTKNLLLNANPSTTLRTSVMPTGSNVTATTTQMSNIINGTTINTAATTQLTTVIASSSIISASAINTSNGSKLTTSVDSKVTTQPPLLSSIISTLGTVSDATTNIKASNSISISTPTLGGLPNTTSNIPSVSSAANTLRTTLVPTISSIVTTSSSSTNTNLSTTIQPFSSTTLPTSTSTSAIGANSSGNLTAFTSTRANGLSLSTNGVVPSFVTSMTSSSSNDLATSRLNGVSSSAAVSSNSFPSAITATTTLRTVVQSTTSAATTSSASSISASTVTSQSSNGTGLSSNVPSSTSGYNISSFITSLISSTRTMELPVNSNISTPGITSNVVRTTSIISEITSNRLTAGVSPTGLGITTSGTFSNPKTNAPSVIDTTTVPILSAAVSSNISVLKTDATSPTPTMQTTIASNPFTKSISDISSTTVSNLRTTDISITSSIRTTGGSTSSLGSNGSDVTTSNTLILNVTRSNVTAFTMLSIPTSLPGIMSNVTGNIMTPVVTLRPTELTSTSTSYVNKTANIMQTTVGSTSASGKTPDTYSNPVTMALDASSGMKVTGPPTSGGISNTNQTTPAVSSTNGNSLSGIPTTGTKTSQNPIVSPNVLVFNATMSLRPSGGLPFDITTTAVTTNTIGNPKINESMQTTRASVFSGSLPTSGMTNNSTKSLQALALEATNATTVMPAQSIILAGIASNTSISPSTSMVNMTTSTGLAAVNIRTSTIAAQSSISNLFTTLGSRVLNSTTGLIVPSAVNSTAEPTFSTQNRVQSSANTSSNNAWSQGVSTAVPTVQRVAADPLMALNVQATFVTPTGLSPVTASRPINTSMSPMDNGTQVSYLPALSQSNQAPIGSIAPGVTKGALISTSSGTNINSLSTYLPLGTTASPSISNTKGTATSSVWDRSEGSTNSLLQNTLSTGASVASFTTTGNKSAPSIITVRPTVNNTTKRKNLISILWSLIFPALASLKSPNQAASKLNGTTETAMYGQLEISNLTGKPDLNPISNSSSTGVPKQDPGSNIEIVHVSYLRIKGGGSLLQPVQSFEDTQDTDIMESLKVLEDDI